METEYLLAAAIGTNRRPQQQANGFLECLMATNPPVRDCLPRELKSLRLIEVQLLVSS